MQHRAAAAIWALAAVAEFLHAVQEVYLARRVHVPVAAVRTAVDVPAVPAVPMADRQAVAARTAAVRIAVAEAAIQAVAVVAMVVHRVVAVVVANKADIRAHTHYNI